MPLPDYLIAHDGDACRCGRIASREHCPFCGTFKVRWMPSLSTENHRFFQCEKGHRFQDNGDVALRIRNCEATPYQTKLQRAAMELNRTRNAIADGHPLTEREEKLAPVVTDIPDIAKEKRLEFAHYKLAHPWEKDLTLEQYLKREDEQAQQQ
jgi:hypothetical protein